MDNSSYSRCTPITDEFKKQTPFSINIPKAQWAIPEKIQTRGGGGGGVEDILFLPHWNF